MGQIYISLLHIPPSFMWDGVEEKSASPIRPPRLIGSVN